MKKLSKISKIFIFDTYYEPESSEINTIEIGVSNDHNLYYEPNRHRRQEKPFVVGENVSFEDYSGKIIVPQFTGIEIIQTHKTILGVTNSPMNISHEGNINLTILKNSGLELCLNKVDKTIVNDLKCKRNGSAQRGEYNYNGRNFNKYYNEYSNYLLDIIDDIEVVNGEYGQEIDYGKIYDIRTLDVCKHNDIVYVNNQGSRFIRYADPTTHDITSRNIASVKHQKYLRKEFAKEKQNNLIRNGDLDALLKKYKTKLVNAKTPEEKKEVMDKISMKIGKFVSKDLYEQAAVLRNLQKNIDDEKNQNNDS